MAGLGDPTVNAVRTHLAFTLAHPFHGGSTGASAMATGIDGLPERGLPCPDGALLREELTEGHSTLQLRLPKRPHIKGAHNSPDSFASFIICISFISFSVSSGSSFFSS